MAAGRAGFGSANMSGTREANSGMPITRDGHRVKASPNELKRWPGREPTGEPARIAAESADLASGLKRGLRLFGNARRFGKRSERRRVGNARTKTRFGRPALITRLMQNSMNLCEKIIS